MTSAFCNRGGLSCVCWLFKVRNLSRAAAGSQYKCSSEQSPPRSMRFAQQRGNRVGPKASHQGHSIEQQGRARVPDFTMLFHAANKRELHQPYVNAKE